MSEIKVKGDASVRRPEAASTVPQCPPTSSLGGRPPGAGVHAGALAPPALPHSEMPFVRVRLGGLTREQARSRAGPTAGLVAGTMHRVAAHLEGRHAERCPLRHTVPGCASSGKRCSSGQARAPGTSVIGKSGMSPGSPGTRAGLLGQRASQRVRVPASQGVSSLLGGWAHHAHVAAPTPATAQSTALSAASCHAPP